MFTKLFNFCLSFNLRSFYFIIEMINIYIDIFRYIPSEFKQTFINYLFTSFVKKNFFSLWGKSCLDLYGMLFWFTLWKSHLLMWIHNISNVENSYKITEIQSIVFFYMIFYVFSDVKVAIYFVQFLLNTIFSCQMN